MTDVARTATNLTVSAVLSGDAALAAGRGSAGVGPGSDAMDAGTVAGAVNPLRAVLLSAYEANRSVWWGMRRIWDRWCGPGESLEVLVAGSCLVLARRLRQVRWPVQGYRLPPVG